MGDTLKRRLLDNPIIAAVRDMKDLDEALDSNVEVVFLLTGNLLNIKEAVEKINMTGKLSFVHVDLVEGLSKDLYALDFIINEVKPFGIISTKGPLIKHAKARGIYSIQRLFLLDSQNLKSGISSIIANTPDAVEILPGVMPKIISMVVRKTKKLVIAGGLISDKEDVILSLKAGAQGISSSNKTVWEL